MISNTTVYDAAIIGGGPAGTAAAILLTSDGRSVLLCERDNEVGGRIRHAAWVDNMPPLGLGMTGRDWQGSCSLQLDKFGVSVLLDTDITSIDTSIAGSFLLNAKYAATKGRFAARTVLIATGMVPRVCRYNVDDTLVVPAPSEYVYPGESVILIGGGNSIAQLALRYYNMRAVVTLISTRPIESTVSNYLVKDIRNSSIQRFVATVDKVWGIAGDYHTVIQETGGESHLLFSDHVQIHTGYECDNTHWPVELKEGKIVVDSNYMTNIPGIFAAGDATVAGLERLGIAIGTGQAAGRSINLWLDRMGVYVY